TKSVISKKHIELKPKKKKTEINVKLNVSNLNLGLNRRYSLNQLNPSVPIVRSRKNSINAFNADNVLVSDYDCKITNNDIKTLLPNQCLNDNIIHFYLNLLASSCGKKCYVTSSYLFLSYIQSQKATQWFKKVKSEIFDYLIIPVFQTSRKHWSLVFIDCIKKKVFYLDSIFSTPKYVVDQTNDALSAALDQLKEIKIWPVECYDNNLPRQNNATDCDIKFCPKEINKFRFHIKNEILNKCIISLEKSLVKFSKVDFNILHININSLINKGYEIQQILDQANFDLIFISETRLNPTRPTNQFLNSNYNQIFYYRPSDDSKSVKEIGGGLLVYMKNGLKILRQKISSTRHEYIYIQIIIRNQVINFIHSYKAPNYKNDEYLEKLDNLIFSLDPNIPLFIIGDLNMDNFFNRDLTFNEFLSCHSLINFIIDPTRTKTRYFSHDMQFRTKSSQLDVILHNGNLIKESRTIECPFSDHSFITAKLGIQAVTKETKTIFGRNLSFNNIQLIIAEIVKLDFDQFNMFGSVDLQWAAFKTKVHLILDNISPIKEIK
ncbi:Sentrin-specific protease, partial [Brachionus plicatilis]